MLTSATSQNRAKAVKLLKKADTACFILLVLKTVILWVALTMNASNYKQAREKLRLSQSALAEKLGVTTKTINNRENRRKPIGKEAQMALEFLLLSNP